MTWEFFENTYTEVVESDQPMNESTVVDQQLLLLLLPLLLLLRLLIQVVLIADGQITAGPKIVKPNARKLRRLATEPQPSLGGFAGGGLAAPWLWKQQGIDTSPCSLTNPTEQQLCNHPL